MTDTSTYLNNCPAYPFNLLNDIKQFHCNDESLNIDDASDFPTENPSHDQIKGLEYAIDLLPKQKQVFLLSRYNKQLSLGEISALYGVSRESVRQNISEALRMICMSSGFDAIQLGYDAYAQYINDRISLFSLLVTDEAKRQYRNEALKRMTIRLLNPSGQLYNVLAKNQIFTLYDLCRKTERELQGLPNFGVVKLKEVKQALSVLNLSLARRVPPYKIKKSQRR